MTRALATNFLDLWQRAGGVINTCCTGFLCSIGLLANGNYRDAMLSFNNYLDEYHGDAFAHAYRGLAYMMLGDYKKALVDLD